MPNLSQHAAPKVHTPLFCVFACLSYDDTRSRKHGFALAAHRSGMPTIYIEPPGSHSPFTVDGRPPSLSRTGGLAPSGDGPSVLAVPKKWRLGPARVQLPRRRMPSEYRRWIAQAFSSIRAQHGPLIALVTDAHWEERLRDIPFDAIIYDKTDEPENVRRRLSMDEYLSHERAMIARSDLLIAASRPLLDDVHKSRPDMPAVVIPNGMHAEDFERWRNEPVPELDGVSEPVIGFLGSVAPFIDVPLLERAARAYPQYRFAVVGPAVPRDRADGLRKIPNVDVWGRVAHTRVPSIMNRFTVGLLPLLDGAVSETANPVTFYEHMLLGNPLVATPMPQLAAHRDLYYASRVGFVEAIAEALTENDPDRARRRHEFAKQYTWTNLFARIMDALPGWSMPSKTAE